MALKEQNVVVGMQKEQNVVGMQWYWGNLQDIRGYNIWSNDENLRYSRYKLKNVCKYSESTAHSDIYLNNILITNRDYPLNTKGRASDVDNVPVNQHGNIQI